MVFHSCFFTYTILSFINLTGVPVHSGLLAYWHIPLCIFSAISVEVLVGRPLKICNLINQIFTFCMVSSTVIQHNFLSLWYTVQDILYNYKILCWDHSVFVALTFTCSDIFFMLPFLVYICYYSVDCLFSNTSLLFNIFIDICLF